MTTGGPLADNIEEGRTVPGPVDNREVVGSNPTDPSLTAFATSALFTSTT